MNYFSVAGIVYYRTLDEIIDFVSKTTGIEREKIISKSRKREYVNARQTCAYLIRRKFPKQYSLGEIAISLGYGRSHADVIHAIKTIENAIETEPKFKARIDQMNLILEIK